MPKIAPKKESKLSKTIAKLTQDEDLEKAGFLGFTNQRSTCYKTKSFRLRELDALNLKKIVNEINKTAPRKNYSDSEVIRGLINFISSNFDINLKKLIHHINNSS